ncbi:MAG: hypothetical protein H6843_17585 [Rhodospirillaceae bacterium]|nr:hypothetical protein [Rhodospirillaceae bacterium]
MPDRDRAKPSLTATRDPVAPPGNGTPAGAPPPPKKRPLIALRRPAAAETDGKSQQQTARKRPPLTAAREATDRQSDRGLRRRAGGTLASLLFHAGLLGYLLFGIGTAQPPQAAAPPSFDLTLVEADATRSVFGSPEMVAEAVPDPLAAPAPPDTMAEAAVEPEVAEPPADEAPAETPVAEAPATAAAEAEVLTATAPEAVEDAVAAAAAAVTAPAPTVAEPPHLALAAAEPVDTVADTPPPAPPTAEPPAPELLQPVVSAEAAAPPAPDVPSAAMAVDPVPLPVPSDTVAGVLPPAFSETPEALSPLTGEPPPPAPSQEAEIQLAEVQQPSGETAPPPPDLQDMRPDFTGAPPPPPAASETVGVELIGPPNGEAPLAEVEAPTAMALQDPGGPPIAEAPPPIPILEAAGAPTVITDVAVPVADAVTPPPLDGVTVSDPAAPADLVVSDPVQVASLPPDELLPVHDPMEEMAMEEMAAELARALDSVPCARLAAQVDPGSGVLELRGHLRDRADLQSLVERLGQMPGVDWVDDSRLQMVGEPLCVVVEQVLGPLLRRQSPAPDSLGEAVQSANLAAAPGDQVTLTIGGVDFRAFIQVDWYESGERVVHLMQGADFGIDGWPARHPFTLAPGRPGLPLATDGPERETLVTAIVTSQPLFAERRPMVEPLSVYVDDLRVRLAEVAVPSFGIQVEITYALLRITPPRELPATD